MPRSARGIIVTLAVGAVLALSSCTSIPVDANPRASAGVQAGTDMESSPRPPTAAVAAAPDVEALTAQYAAVRLDSMTLTEKVASMFIVRAPGLDGPGWQATVASRGLGGLILMGDNIPGTTDELRALTDGVTSGPGLSPLISIDEEGGDVVRLPQDSFAGADSLSALPEQATLDAFGGRAALLESAGVSVNFGIVADVTADPSSFIFSRVFGGEPAAVSSRVTAAVTGERGSVFSTLKHFPGHGETEGDSHSSIPATPIDEASWRARDAPPFAAGIASGAELVMFGHLVYSSVDAQPASLSPAWHAVLRDEMHFGGVTITDDMGMLEASGLAEYQDPNENAVRAVAAGNDLLLYVSPTNLDAMIAAVTTAVESGRIDPSIVDAAVTRGLELRRTLWLRQHPEQNF